MCLFSPLSGRFDHKSIFSLSKPISKSKTNRIGYHISLFNHLHLYLHPPPNRLTTFWDIMSNKQSSRISAPLLPLLSWGPQGRPVSISFHMQLLNNNWRIVSFLFQLFLFPCPCRVPLWALSVLSRSIFVSLVHLISAHLI